MYGALSRKVDFFGSLGRTRSQFTQVTFESTIRRELLRKIANKLFDGLAKEWGVRAFVPLENSEGFVYFQRLLDEPVNLLVTEVFHHHRHLSR